MKIQGQLEWKDYLAANYLHQRPRLLYRIAGILLILLALFISFSVILFGEEDNSAGWLPFVLLFLLIYLAVIYGVFLPLRARKIFHQQKSLKEPFVADITDQGMEAESAIGLTRMAWGDYLKWKENKRFILLYHSDLMFQIFPKRCFEPGQFEEFRNLLEEKLGRPRA